MYTRKILLRYAARVKFSAKLIREYMYCVDTITATTRETYSPSKVPFLLYTYTARENRKNWTDSSSSRENGLASPSSNFKQRIAPMIFRIA